MSGNPEIDSVHAVAREALENGCPIPRSVLGFLRPNGQRVGRSAAHLRRANNGLKVGKEILPASIDAEVSQVNRSVVNAARSLADHEQLLGVLVFERNANK